MVPRIHLYISRSYALYTIDKLWINLDTAFQPFATPLLEGEIRWFESRKARVKALKPSLLCCPFCQCVSPIIVEVADSTLRHDCEIKDKLYAQAGIEDYWVVDVKKRQLHVFRNPTPTGYTSHLSITQAHSIAPLFFPDRLISLADIFIP